MKIIVSRIILITVLAVLIAAVSAGCAPVRSALPAVDRTPGMESGYADPVMCRSLSRG